MVLNLQSNDKYYLSKDPVVSNVLKLGNTTSTKTYTLHDAKSSGNVFYATLNALTTAGDLSSHPSISMSVYCMKDEQYSSPFDTPNGKTFASGSSIVSGGTSSASSATTSATGTVGVDVTITWDKNESLSDFVTRINNSANAQAYGYSVSYSDGKKMHSEKPTAIIT